MLAAVGSEAAALLTLLALLELVLDAEDADPPHCETTSFPAVIVPWSFSWAVERSDSTVGFVLQVRYYIRRIVMRIL